MGFSLPAPRSYNRRKGYWPLTNEAIANRLFDEIEQREEALVERCVKLLDQAKTISNPTNYHWWTQEAA